MGFFSPRLASEDPSKSPFAPEKLQSGARYQPVHHVSDGHSDPRVSRGVLRSMFDGNDVLHHVTDVYEKGK